MSTAPCRRSPTWSRLTGTPRTSSPLYQRRTKSSRSRFPGAPSGGTFTLDFEGETTGPIAYDATADQVGDALMSLANIGQGNIIATGGPVNGGVVSIAFTNALATTAVDQITGDPSGLISSGTPPEVVTSVDSVGSPGEITSNVNTLSVGFTAQVRVILEGEIGGTQSTFPGLTIESDHNTIRGLIIDGFSTGISIQGPAAVGNLIQGNYIGQYVSFLNPLIINEPISTVQGIGNGVGVSFPGPATTQSAAFLRIATTPCPGTCSREW